MKTILSVLLTISCLHLFAQKSSLNDRELLVQKEYNNEIYDVNPIFNYASISVRSPSSMDFYKDSLSRISIYTPDVDVTIRPIVYKTLSEESGHQGFIKLDKGVINPIHTQAAYSYSAENYFNINASLDYDNRNEEKVNDKYVKTIDATLGMDYYLTKEIKTNIGVRFNRNTYGLYGSHELFDVEESTGNTGFQKITANIGMQSFNTFPSLWNFGIEGKLSSWQDEASTGIERNINTISWVSFRINDIWSMELKPQYKYAYSQTFGNKSILSGTFNLAFNEPGFYLKTGATLDYFNQEINLWPQVDLRWKVSSTTDIDIRSMSQAYIMGAQKITSINPYLSISELINHEKTISYNRNLSLKVSSTFIDNIKLEMNAAYLNAIHELNFIINPTDIRTFDYDAVDFERLRLGFALFNKLWDDQITIGLTVQYDKYAKATSTLFHRPTLMLMPSVQSNLFNNKIKMRLSALINNPQSLDNIPALNTESSWRYNLSYELSFRITDQLNIQLNADNIFDDEYQVWRGYDNFGRNLSGGLLFKF